MMNYYLLFISCFLSVTTLSCQKAKTTETVESPAAPAVPPPPVYPALGNQDISQLYSQADKVDIIFYELPISVNQEDPNSVKSTVLYVSPAAPNITATCKPLGRLSWMHQGKIIREADVYCATGCEYLLFMEGNTPVAANAMGPEGVSFFKNILSQVEKLKK
jgi:hypothetical protein